MGKYCPILKAAGIGEAVTGVPTMNPEVLDSESKMIASFCLACKREKCYYDEEYKRKCVAKSERIEQVGQYLSQGMSTKEIIAKMGITVSTFTRYRHESLK